MSSHVVVRSRDLSHVCPVGWSVTLPEVGFADHLVVEIVAVVGQEELVAAGGDDVLGHRQAVLVRWGRRPESEGVGIGGSMGTHTHTHV